MRGPSTFRNESRMRMYSITARRITSGEVLKYRDGLRWAMPEWLDPDHGSRVNDSSLGHSGLAL
jgi:hypothetical protein